MAIFNSYVKLPEGKHLSKVTHPAPIGAILAMQITNHCDLGLSENRVYSQL